MNIIFGDFGARQNETPTKGFRVDVGVRPAFLYSPGVLRQPHAGSPICRTRDWGNRLNLICPPGRAKRAHAARGLVQEFFDFFFGKPGVFDNTFDRQIIIQHSPGSFFHSLFHSLFNSLFHSYFFTLFSSFFSQTLG